MQVPIALSLVDDPSQYLGHNVDYLLNTLVTIAMTGDRSKLAHAQKLMHSWLKLGAQVQAVVREYGARAPPQGNVLVHQDIGCTLRGELSGNKEEHVRSTTEAIGEQQDFSFVSWYDGKGPK